MNFTKSIRIVAVLTLISFHSLAQTDTLVFSTGELIVGEIKGMDRNILTIETAYSDSDFTIDWSMVKLFYSSQYFLVTLEDGRRFNARMRSAVDDGYILIDDGTNQQDVHFYDIVYFNPISTSFWDKFSASVDIGLQLTKANNLRQFNTRTTLGYLTKRWELNGNYNTVLSAQDSVPDTRRMDANVGFRFFLPNDWYVFVSNDFLQNDEQKLELRSNLQLGAGYYLIHTNTLYWSLFAGAAFNNETFTEATTPDRQSGEAFGGMELNLFNTGDLSLVTSTLVYPSITENGRIRVDFKFDVKYDLPLDFYIKAGTTVNYDNQPIAGASDLDYVFQTGIGWEW